MSLAGQLRLGTKWADYVLDARVYSNNTLCTRFAMGNTVNLSVFPMANLVHSVLFE